MEGGSGPCQVFNRFLSWRPGKSTLFEDPKGGKPGELGWRDQVCLRIPNLVPASSGIVGPPKYVRCPREGSHGVLGDVPLPARMFNIRLQPVHPERPW